MKSNNDAASVKCCARKIWAHFKEFVASVKGDLKETHDEMFQGADTPKQRLQRSVKHGLLLLAQLCLIMGVYAAGCALASVLPITLPGNILGMVLLLVLLGTHILKTKYISEACDYLIDNMSVFFIPAGVAIRDGINGASAKMSKSPEGGSLFDLEKDPKELDNVASQHPDICEQMKAKLEEIRQRPETKADQEDLLPLDD